MSWMLAQIFDLATPSPTCEAEAAVAQALVALAAPLFWCWSNVLPLTEIRCVFECLFHQSIWYSLCLCRYLGDVQILSMEEYCLMVSLF